MLFAEDEGYYDEENKFSYFVYDIDKVEITHETEKATLFKILESPEFS